MTERQTRITKLKINDGKISISYAVPSVRDQEGWCDMKLTSEDAPLPEFIEALAAVKPELLQVLELPASYGANLHIVGAVFSYKAETLCTSLIAEKALKSTRAELTIKSPSLPEAAPESNPDAEGVLPTKAALAVNELLEQCRRYLRGERAQGQLLVDLKPEPEKP
jgi:hypothetical protein